MTSIPLPTPSQDLPVLKELNCPHCGSPIHQYLASAQTLVCASCGSHIGLSADGLAVLGAGMALPPTPIPIALGMKATFKGTTFVVLGRVLFEGHDPDDHEDTWQWNEWLLGGIDGRLLWLEYDKEDGYVLSTKIRLRAAFNPQTDAVIPLGNGKMARVRERYPARIVGAEGELTWQAKVNDESLVIDAAGDGKRYSVEADTHEIELYEGDALTAADVASAFGHAEWMKSVQAYHAGRRTMVAAGRLSLLFALIGVAFGLLAANSGSLLTSQTIQLSANNPSATIPITIDNPNRPVQIKMQVVDGLPVNTAADADITVIAPDQTETIVLEHEFFYEKGIDTGVEDGEAYSEAYSETDYSADSTFVPTQAGTHDIDVAWTPGAGVSIMSIKVDIYKDHITSTWFYIYAGVSALLGSVLLFIGSRHKVSAGAVAVKPASAKDSSMERK